MPDIFTAKKKIAHHTPDVAEKVDDLFEKLHITTDRNLPQGKVNLFTNFRLFPEGLTVQNQEADEILVLFLRRDLATNIPWVILSLLLLFIPPLLPLLPDELNLSFLTPVYVFVITSFYYLLVVGFAILNFVSWFYNISVVTNQRVIDIDYANITYKHVSATTIDNVEDISYAQAGFLRSFFDFGTVLVQTKGEILNFEFNEVPKPAKVVDIVIDLVRQREKKEET